MTSGLPRNVNSIKKNIYKVKVFVQVYLRKVTQAKDYLSRSAGLAINPTKILGQHFISSTLGVSLCLVLTPPTVLSEFILTVQCTVSSK